MSEMGRQNSVRADGLPVLAAVIAMALLAWPTAVPAAESVAKLNGDAYSALIAKAESGATDVDYLELRKQTSARLAYVEKNWAEWRMADNLVDTKPEEALSLAKARMSGVWTDFLAHVVAQLAFEKLGKHDDAEREKTIVNMIVRSISGGHKGTSAEDAFNAVSIAEEYRTLMILRWKVKSQSLVNNNGHMYDVFQVIDSTTNQQRAAWFNIDVFFGKEFGL